MPRFLYCRTIWHFSGVRNSEKLELLKKHVLRIILGDKVSTYEVLLESQFDKEGNSRYVDFILQVLSSSHTCLHISIFIPRTNINGLRGINSCSYRL